MVRVSFYLPTDVALALQALADQHGNTRNAELVLAVRARLADKMLAPSLEGVPPQPEAKAPASRSPWRTQRASVAPQHALRSRQG